LLYNAASPQPPGSAEVGQLARLQQPQEENTVLRGLSVLAPRSGALLLVAFLAACQQPTEAPEPAEQPTTAATMAVEPTEEMAPAPEGFYIFGADGLLSATFFENIGETGLGMYFSGPGQPDTSAYADFVAKYEAANGEKPIQSFHARAYDATNMVLDAIEKVGTEGADGSLTIDRKALIEAMYAMSGFQGLTGTLTCNEFGDCASPVIAAMRYEDAAAGVQGVLTNVLDTYSFEMPTQGVGVVPEAEQDSYGVVTIAAGDPIELATLQAITGDVANLGIDQVRAVEIAIADRPEVMGHPVEMSMEEDDLCSAEGGTTGAQRIIANPQVVAVIGTSCSGAAVPAAEALSEQGILMISGSNTSPRLTATGYFSAEGPVRGEAWQYGYFRSAHNDEFQGRAAAQFAFEQLSVTKAATIHDGDPYTQGLAGAFGGSFEEFGGEIVLATAVTKEQEDMRPVLTEVQASGAQMLFFPIFEPAGDRIVQQAEEVGLVLARP
jgi:ABC-type branched-subunit amino acid transport system substrate-binding protein